jgi:bifunctional non-homologous end joining protein LigD
VHDTSGQTWRVAVRALPLSQLDQLVWPEVGVSTGDLLRYYLRVAPTLMPHFRDRPVTMRIISEGARGRSLYARAVLRRPELAALRHLPS